MGRKGITSIIAIIMLLFITVTLAGVTFTFLQGYLLPQISRAFVVPPNGAFCTGKLVKVLVLNTGYQTDILTPEDWVVAEVAAVDITQCPGSQCGLTGETIPTGEAKKVVEWDCDPDGDVAQCTGTHYITLGTSSTVQQITVFCR